MADDFISTVRNRWLTDRISTHYDGCWQYHHECVVRILVDEVEQLRIDLKEAYDACRYALADSPRWRENVETVIATWNDYYDPTNTESEEETNIMVEDIAASLRLLMGSCKCSVCKDRLEAINEIERLRSAGDALVDVLRSGSDTGWDNAIDAWEKIRHKE